MLGIRAADLLVADLRFGGSRRIERRNKASALHIPELACFVRRAGEDLCAIRGPGQAVYSGIVAAFLAKFHLHTDKNMNHNAYKMRFDLANGNDYPHRRH